MWRLPESLRQFGDVAKNGIVLELIETFLNDTDRRLERLRGAVVRQDSARVKAEAHSIRGSAMQMGANSLADLCHAVETGASRLDSAEMEQQVRELSLRFADVRRAMTEYVMESQRT